MFDDDSDGFDDCEREYTDRLTGLIMRGGDDPRFFDEADRSLGDVDFDVYGSCDDGCGRDYRD